MKITKARLKQIIKEELESFVTEAEGGDIDAMVQDYTERIRTSGRTSLAITRRIEDLEGLVRNVIQKQMDSGKSTRYSRIAGMVANEAFEMTSKASAEKVKHLPRTDYRGPSGRIMDPGSDR